jgi:hypothetical protein
VKELVTQRVYGLALGMRIWSLPFQSGRAAPGMSTPSRIVPGRRPRGKLRRMRQSLGSFLGSFSFVFR